MIDAVHQARIEAGPPDPKKLAELVSSAAQTAKLTGTPEVSALHLTHPPQGGDWMFCMKGSGPNEMVRYAVFVRDSSVLEVRSGVVIDGCASDTYRPLALP
jgi:hypothetical protein